ncbi:MAG TPA: ankyrin repeat domain-containing protein [Acetobacteraceae bacterium]|nr:ankyrin repeat domain-containing protein [Acetobacteraceae bacterium]
MEGKDKAQIQAVALLVASAVGDLEQVEALVPLCGAECLEGPPGAPVTPLMAAAAGGHDAVVEALLRRGADASRRDPRGHSAAWFARAAGHPHLAERLDTVVDQEKRIW